MWFAASWNDVLFTEIVIGLHLTEKEDKIFRNQAKYLYAHVKDIIIFLSLFENILWTTNYSYMYYYFWKHKFHDTIVCIYPFRLEDYLFPCPNTKIHQRVYLYLNCGVCNQGIGLTQIIYVMQWRWFTPNVTIIIIIAIRFSQVKCNQVLVLSGVPKHFGSQKQ